MEGRYKTHKNEIDSDFFVRGSVPHKLLVKGRTFLNYQHNVQS